MAGLLKANLQLGDSATATQNFTLSVPAVPDGTLKLARGNAGATTQDILTVGASGLVGFPVSKAIETPVKDALNATGSAPVYACRAWVNFNGTGTVAIRASGNVSSITDNGTGDYTVNFTTAMPDANYAAALSTEETGTEMHSSNTNIFNQTATQSKLRCCLSGTSTGYDPDTVNAVYFR